MAASVVAILDRDNWEANTDIIVVADDRRRWLTWVPRDIWSTGLHDRVNRAFLVGGCDGLIAALGELGLACDSALVLRRSVSEAMLAPITVTVPVPRRLDFWYPLAPTLPIEEGRKQVTFLPPSEELTGERIHQWIGARKEVGGGGSDLSRIQRQQVLLDALLEQGFDFAAAIRPPDLIRLAGDPFAVLQKVNSHWKMKTFGPSVPAMIGPDAVLLAVSPLELMLRRARRIPAKLRSLLGGDRD